MFCPDYPPHNYNLIVEDSEGNMTIQTSLATGSLIKIDAEDLMEDTRYCFYVVAPNQFGSSNQSSSVEISMCREF